MSGYQAKRTRGKNEVTRHIPVIFVSNKNGEADRAWGLRQGAHEYVTKPVDPTLLLTAISEAVAA
jgi:twitching motility two-component system response regulator PilH